MSSDGRNALTLQGVGKMYKVFDSKRDNFLDALSLGKLRPWRKVSYRQFWALRGVDLEVGHGNRVGIIGRNGAGKSTLLKLVTGNLAATEGSIEIDGTVQALLDAGGGLHPEFTGYENIRASLIYQGLAPKAMQEAIDDIAEFTELGEFLSQPFKTYSLGMQARLAFAIATTIKPDILIIDEVLGAGDAYFFSKSMSRMRELVESGASVVIVSHALDQIQRFCPETIWLERGQIVQRGPTSKVIREYELFIRSLEDRRLRSKSERMLNDRSLDARHDLYARSALIRLTVPIGVEVRVQQVTLARGEEIEDKLHVGAPQDADTGASAFVDVYGSEDWSAPAGPPDSSYRSIDAKTARKMAAVIFNLWSMDSAASYSASIRFQATGPGASVELISGDDVFAAAELVPTTNEWATAELQVVPDAGAVSPEDSQVQPRDLRAGTRPPAGEPTHWPGEGKLRVEKVTLFDKRGAERAVFEVGEPISVEVDIRAEESGAFPVMLAALIFRLDGVVVSRHVSACTTLDIAAARLLTARLDLEKLTLGNGYYAVSVGIYRQLDLNDIDPSVFYDYVDRSFEFQMVGAPKMHNELILDVGSWTLVANDEDERSLPPLWSPARTGVSEQQAGEMS